MSQKILIGITFFGLLAANSASAVCPVCTIAVAGGVGFSRWLGIDDTISGLWIGGLVISMIVWTVSWLNQKNIRFKGRKIIVFLSYYLLIVAPLYWTGILNHPYNKLWGLDKLLLGIFLGSAGFTLGAWAYFYSKSKRGGKALFPFQKVVFPVAPVLILSIIFYFITK